MQFLPHKSEKVRALIAIGLQRNGLVIATDSRWLAWDIDSITDDPDDLGIDIRGDRLPGLHLWEGMVKEVSSNHEAYEPESQYDGTLRPVLPEEMTALLAMEPTPDPYEGEYPT